MNFVQDAPHLAPQCIPGKRLRESMKVLRLALGVNPFVIEESIQRSEQVDETSYRYLPITLAVTGRPISKWPMAGIRAAK